MVVAVWGGVSTAAHFIGYSFLQGRIAGHGLGEHELTLSTFESVMQAGYNIFRSGKTGIRGGFKNPLTSDVTVQVLLLIPTYQASDSK